MGKLIQLPIIAGVEITTDKEGRFNLNALHRASEEGKHKAPNKWLETQAAQELIAELESQTPNSGSGDNSTTCLNVIRGGNAPGTFAHELIAVSYAGWISPAFQLNVNRVFIEYRSGRLAPVQPQLPQDYKQALLQLVASIEENEKLQKQIERDRPKVEFAETVRSCPGTLSIREFAKALGTGQNRMFQWLRESGYLMAGNLPYQRYIDNGYFRVIERIVTIKDEDVVKTKTLITGKGQVAIEKKWRDARAA